MDTLGADMMEIKRREANAGFLYKEAFCIMEYHCKKCNKSELIWNSRDGVTPFIISCSSCGSEMRHINWHGDRRDVMHIPEKGERIFINMPEEVHLIYMRKRVNDFWDNPSIPKPADKTKEELIQDLHKGWDKESPFIITWE